MIASAPLVSRSGIDFFEGIFSDVFRPAPISDTLDSVVIDIKSDAVIFQGRPNSRHCNPLGTVHRSWLATLPDTAAGRATHSTLPAGKGFSALLLKINMTRTLTEQVPLICAMGSLIHAISQVAMQRKIVEPDGKLYADAATTYLIFNHPAHKNADLS